jgi:hypothetical protein
MIVHSPAPTPVQPMPEVSAPGTLPSFKTVDCKQLVDEILSGKGDPTRAYGNISHALISELQNFLMSHLQDKDGNPLPFDKALAEFEKYVEDRISNSREDMEVLKSVAKLNVNDRVKFDNMVMNPAVRDQVVTEIMTAVKAKGGALRTWFEDEQKKAINKGKTQEPEILSKPNYTLLPFGPVSIGSSLFKGFGVGYLGMTAIDIIASNTRFDLLNLKSSLDPVQILSNTAVITSIMTGLVFWALNALKWNFFNRSIPSAILNGVAAFGASQVLLYGSLVPMGISTLLPQNLSLGLLALGTASGVTLINRIPKIGEITSGPIKYFDRLLFLPVRAMFKVLKKDKNKGTPDKSSE